ncbi:ABC transporter permease [Phytoactinopolyspora limicola]|uniref:ABC transporter permease n=1 Tax=Phytoactinopolyspora limicola TaxID=2715536 RepID=UPI00140B2804|nr:ABC transporter permease [Phytoactinopolyspora limicola]
MSRVDSEARARAGSGAPGRTPTPARIFGSVRRVTSLSRAELRLLLRNRTALFVGAALPLLTVVFLRGVDAHEDSGFDAAQLTVVSMIGLALLYVVYYNLVSTYVARREELVLKRLRAGELSDPEILLGVAVPAVALAVAQIILVTLGAFVLLDLSVPVNPLLIVVAVIGGIAVFVLLAAASTAMTRNVEMAQMSTLPLFAVCVIFSGLFIPLDSLPDTLGDVASYLPLTPVVELCNLGWSGTIGPDAPVDFAATFGEAAAPTVILVAWIVIGAWLTRRGFRWEPRR